MTEGNEIGKGAMKPVEFWEHGETKIEYEESENYIIVFGSIIRDGKDRYHYQLVANKAQVAGETPGAKACVIAAQVAKCFADPINFPKPKGVLMFVGG